MQDRNKKGFILPLTMLLCSLIVLLSFSVTAIIYKEMTLSRLTRDSVLAYHSADLALECALFIDDRFVNPLTGQGIFPNNQSSTYISEALTGINLSRSGRSLPSLALNDIVCAGVPVFDNAISSFATSPWTYKDESGVSHPSVQSLYKMKWSAGDGAFRCAQVAVQKYDYYRRIIAQGYSSCDVNSSFRVERAVVSETK